MALSRGLPHLSRGLPHTGPGPWNVLQQAARNHRYKLIRGTNLPKQLYDLWADPLETVDLLHGALSVEGRRALRQLEFAVDGLGVGG